MTDNSLQQRWRDLRRTIRSTFRIYTPLLWRFPDTRKHVIQVVWRRPLLIVKWLFILVGICIVLPILFLKLILFGYTITWTGFQGHPTPQYQPMKTFWDWLQLLIIPIILAAGGYFFNRLLDKRSRDIASDQQQDTALQNYLDDMSELLITKKLRDSK